MHLVNHCNKANGHVNVSVDLACTQAKNGHEVAYACAGGDFIELLQAHGVQVFRVSPTHGTGVFPFQYMDATWTLGKALFAFRPDVVHVHMAAQSALMQPFRLFGFKTVTTVHNEFDKFVRLMGLATRIVSVSRAGAEAMARRGFDKKRIRVVINGSVESPRLPASFTTAKLAKPSVLTLCGLHPRKGVADLLKAFQIVLETSPDANLFLVGEGPMRKEYEELAVSLGISDKAHFLGHSEDPREYLFAADIFVLASHADPGPLVIAEARRAGCAMIATNVDGIPEMLDFGKSGLLVEPKRPDLLADAISRLLKNPDELKMYAELAKANTDRFTIGRVCRDMDEVYSEIA